MPRDPGTTILASALCCVLGVACVPPISTKNAPCPCAPGFFCCPGSLICVEQQPLCQTQDGGTGDLSSTDLARDDGQKGDLPAVDSSPPDALPGDSIGPDGTVVIDAHVVDTHVLVDAHVVVDSQVLDAHVLVDARVVVDAQAVDGQQPDAVGGDSARRDGAKSDAKWEDAAIVDRGSGDGATDCRVFPCAGLTYCDQNSGQCLPGCDSQNQCQSLEECHLESHICVCQADHYRCGASCCAWQREQVAAETASWTSIAYHPDGYPCIAYRRSNQGLKYACRSTSVWSVEIADGADDSGRYPSLAIDDENNPHIACHRYPDEVRYVRWDNGWTASVLDNSSDSQGYTSLVLDDQNHPHISYRGRHRVDSATVPALYYTTWDGADWHPVVVDPLAYTGTRTAIALDNLGQPHISYFEEFHQVLKYAHWEGQWRVESLDFAGTVSSSTAIALDSQNQPHIVYYQSESRLLSHTVKRAGSWYTSTIDAADVGRYAAMAMDTLNQVHVAYYDATNEDLKYAVGTAGGWQVTVVDHIGSADPETSLVLDPANRPHISYLSGGSALLKYAH